MRAESIIVTGSSGLIGRAVSARLAAAGIHCVGIDLLADEADRRIDIRATERLAPFIEAASGIVHLAAVSRVTDGERDPIHCMAVNVAATRGILRAALAARRRPWVLFASSREVYGQQDRLPVSEDAPCRPIGAYARSKLEAETEAGLAREAGLRTAIIRLSNVYGSMRDHPDRVVPAFAAAASRGGAMRVDGPDCSLDLTHLDDVAGGIERVCELLRSGERMLPTLHFVSGERTTLRELAGLANALGGGRARIIEAPPRPFGARDFVGNPQRARELLGWVATVPLRTGMARLMAEMAAPKNARGAAVEGLGGLATR